MAADSGVVRIAVDVTTIEASVVLGSTPRPEAAILDTLATWFASQTHRQHILGVASRYEEENFVLTIFLGEPLTNQI